MGRSGRIASFKTSIVAIAILTASCAGPAPTPGPSGGPTQAAAGNSLAALPRPADEAAEIGALLRVPAATLDATQARLEDDIVKQIGPGLGPVQLPAPGVVGAAFHAGPVDVGSTGVGFLLIELGIMARALPSKEAAAGLVGMARTAAQGGRDAPDSGRQDDKTASSPFTSTSGDLSSAGSMDTTYGLTADHSLIDFHLGRMLTMNYTKGSDSAHVAIDIDSEESVDFCPDPTGAVPVKVHTVFTLILDTENVTATIDGTFMGQTDAQANLASVTGHASVEGETTSGTSTSKDYGGTVDLTALNGGKTPDGTYEGTGDDVVLAVGAAINDIENSVPTIFDGAKAIWQDSGCVALEAPDLNGRAAFPEKGSASVDKVVDPESKTDFTVQVHDRFRHIEVNLPMKMTLDSQKSIDPTSVASIPASVTYEAPNAPDQMNNVVLESKSLQGSTKLTVRFRTRLPKLILSMVGSIKSQITVGGGATVSMSVTVKKTSFDLNGGGDTPYVEGKASATGQLKVKFAAGSPPCGAVVGTESGTQALIATFAVKDDGTSTWSIHADPAQASFKTVDTCVYTQGFDFGSSGGYIPKMFAAIGPFTIPSKPGTYTVSGSRPTPNGTDFGTATVTVYAPPPTK